VLRDHFVLPKPPKKPPVPSELPASIQAALADGQLDNVLAAAIAHFGCQAGTIHLLRDGVLKLAAHKNIPPPVVQIVSTVPIGKGIAGLAAERREPITICNLQTDTSGQARPGAKATGMEGSLAVPMLADGELRGVLGIAKAEAYDWPPTEVETLTRIAAALAARQ
jgi:signal transduction protein with GAF and PtsI domain